MKNNCKYNIGYIYCLCMALVLLLSQGCAKEISKEPNTIPKFTEESSGQVKLGTSESNLIRQAKEIVIEYELTKLPLICLEFNVLDKLFEGKRIIDVREKHGGSCGGDDNISLRLFSIGIELSTGLIWSDAQSMLGQLEKLEKE